ncbi:hypothetical protein vseg_017441 [Gypsophila vaccaria]
MDFSTSRNSIEPDNKTVQTLTRDRDRDRLSELPDLALVRILSHLHTEEAAKTSVLSKRFNSVWNSVESLSFAEELTSKNGVVFINSVDTALGFHRRDLIEKFSLKLYSNTAYKSSIDRWLKFAVKKQVKSVHLNFNECLRSRMHRIRDFTYTLPEILYRNENIVALVTCWCEFPMKQNISCSRLKLLSMTRSTLEPELISDILSGCNVLETLELRDCTIYDKFKITSSSLRVLRIIGEQSPDFFMPQGDDFVLEISGPNLMSLEVSGILYRTKLILSDLRSLVRAVMAFTIMPQGSSGGFDKEWVAARDQEIARDVLDSLYFAKVMTVGGTTLKALSTREAYNMSSPRSERRSLTVCIPVIQWSHFGISSLLHNSPHLASLVIRLSYCSGMCVVLHDDIPHVDGDDGEHYWKSWNTISKCPLLHLKTVKIIGFQVSCRSMTPLFHFLEFLLSNSKVLEEIVIKATRHVTGATLDEAMMLRSVQTVSPDVVVKFEPPHMWVDPLCMHQESVPLRSDQS